MSEEKAKEKGLKPLARIVAQATNSQHPSEFTIAPIECVKKVLQRWLDQR